MKRNELVEVTKNYLVSYLKNGHVFDDEYIKDTEEATGAYITAKFEQVSGIDHLEVSNQSPADIVDAVLPGTEYRDIAILCVANHIKDKANQADVMDVEKQSAAMRKFLIFLEVYDDKCEPCDLA